MIVLGLLLVLFAVGAAAVAVTAPVTPAQVIEMSALGFKVSASPLAMFLTGAVSVVLLGLGFALISRGTRRKSRTRKELRGLRKDQAAAATGKSADVGGSTGRRHGPLDGSGTDANQTSSKDSSAGLQSERHPDSAPPS